MLNNTSADIPQYFLYGDPPRKASDHFVHLESLAERAAPNHGTIRAHSHSNLSHVFFITAGGGEMRAESVIVRFRAPCLLLIPATVVHEFAFAPACDGTVITVCSAYLRQLLVHDARFASLFDGSREIAMAPESTEKRQIEECVARLQQEMLRSAPGQSLAVEANLLILLVSLLRLSQQENLARHVVYGPHVELVARFRQLIEVAFRFHQSLDKYAQDLHVTAARLRGACLRVTGHAPQELIHDRIELEAKRLLIFSNMRIADLAFHLGFGDPAYFSRFFARRTCESPRSFRQRQKQRAPSQMGAVAATGNGPGGVSLNERSSPQDQVAA